MTGVERLENINPEIFQKLADRCKTEHDFDDSVEDLVDEREIYDLIRNINDPEHPLSLEELNVVSMDRVRIYSSDSSSVKVVEIFITPTIPHCSMATLIGLSVKVKLLRCLSNKFCFHVKITPGTHVQEQPINRQLDDKERVAAALENPQLLSVVNQCLASS